MADPTSTALTPELEALLATRREGHGMPRPFYHTDALYEAEVRKIWYAGWLFAGFTFEIPNPGDYLTFEIDKSSVIVMRDEDGEVGAFHNVCRHRGTQLCRNESGHLDRIVCPYHSWTYSRSGALVACHGMQEDIDKSTHGLKRVHVEVVAGLIYISLAGTPPSFEGLRAEFAAAAKPQGFDRARIAKVIDYEVEGNWKLVWENNRECFHCPNCHPQYIKANFDIYEEEYASEGVRAQIAAAVARTRDKWAAEGIAVKQPKGGLVRFPDPDLDLWYAANRSVMVEGFETESMDGKRVAPLMGDYQDCDVGVLRMRSMVNFWVHGSCDHAVAARLSPAGPRRTKVRGYWLVDQFAQEGVDYDLEKLLPFWHLTNQQDWDISKWQQKGVDSIGYEPGPLSEQKEYNVDAFIRWYLKQMRGGASGGKAVPLTRVA